MFNNFEMSKGSKTNNGLWQLWNGGNTEVLKDNCRISNVHFNPFNSSESKRQLWITAEIDSTSVEDFLRTSNKNYIYLCPF